MRNWKRINAYMNEDVRKAVRAAFTDLKKSELTTRMGFMCCGGCASAALDEIVKKQKTRGAVYFHRQADSRFREDGDLFLMYGAILPKKKKTKADEKTEDALTLAIGWEVVATLRSHGLVVEYPGDHFKCVEVKTKESYWALKARREAEKAAKTKGAVEKVVA